MSFDPSNFAIRKQAAAAILRASDSTAAILARAGKTADTLAALKAAAIYWDGQRSDFAAGKGDTCRDLAAKLEHFGSFVSDRQEAYALKLVEWAKPRQWDRDDRTPLAVQPAPAPRPLPAAPVQVVRLPKLFDLMQRLSKLAIGSLTIARKNGDSLCWVKHEACDKVVGRIENGVLTLWQRPMVDMLDVQRDLLAIEQDPEAAAVRHGKASGSCSICRRDLTDPESIERGIGPICAGKF